MKIFNRGTDGKAPATTAKAAPSAVAPAPAGPAAAAATPPPSPSPAAPAAPPPASPPAASPAPTPAAPDISLLLDANVKEMSEKIARLASTLESSQQERGSFEAKLEQMEERMRKLSSLTEMISAQYNPFVGDAPVERDPMPHPEVGLAATPMPAAAAPPPPTPEAALSLTLAPPEAAPAPEPAFAEPFSEAPPSLFRAPSPSPPPASPAPSFPAEPGVYLWQIQPGFEASMLLLGWADMLLKNAGSRESMLDLVNYYHNIGWIGDPARDQLLAYADGLATPAAQPATDWRANVEVHEKSLLFVEKLRGIGAQRAG